ncbi:hypothetical protein EDD18DRAFT_1332604 [Armillaria luteobubalina]|uniref:CHAT domain-containing protein n=1 Tax=Armillaria luteobubalina TaxID=153913 RepID=A0AA39UVZ2_9AGAR|nr:hypothetical protein EDD18DRAFT_1332604 [Armillaria luteobubalina]
MRTRTLLGRLRARSYLHEKGHPLKLAEIAEHANTNTDFAFLSACQTMMGDISLSDETVHLATGMLVAGYCKVIATMWAVNDSDAPVIAEMVYKHMLSNGKADSGKLCLALHRATASMRQKVGEKNFMSWVPFIHYGARLSRPGVISSFTCTPRWYPYRQEVISRFFHLSSLFLLGLTMYS